MSYILGIDTESSSSIDSKICNVENGVKLNVAELHAIQTAKKHAVRNTVLEHLSGRHLSQSVLNSREVCIVLLVGPTKTKKKYFLEKIAEIDQRFYRAQIHTTKNSPPDLANGIYKTVSPDIFNEMTTDGDDEIEKCANENKILIGFTNLEGALCLKMRGFNVTLILVLPDNKIAYEDALRLSLCTKKQYVDKLKLPITSELSHHMSSISNQSILSKSNSLLTKKEDLYSTDSKMSFNLDNSKLDSFVIHQSLIRNENENLYDELGELESLPQSLFRSEYDSNITEDDSWTNDNSFSDLISECLENINICNDLFEKTTDIFHSRIYNDDNEKALNEISTIMNDILWKYENSDVTIDHILNTEFMSEHIQRRTDQLLSMIR
ncbi:uncharacterized protein LOC126900080 [Daktulosphaira vitifoliae]|uniref:uncharacterized protein LOC126900080 n=1 Tax=Daktulosphaira vitifoliae TaxID=58002 RepID=UPI0021AAA0AE|nr:uncharacterized protein LOC126900080 [Daktulosphaira vitifoliae]